MRRGLFVFTVAMSLVATVMAMAAPPKGSDHSITATGEAKERVAPDMAFVTVYVTGEGILMTDAVKATEELSAKVLDAVHDGQESIRSIDVRDIDIGEKASRSWNPSEAGTTPQPQVTRQIRITIPPEPALAYEVIDAAIRAGALLTLRSSTHYSGEIKGAVVYGLNDDPARDEALLAKALDEARMKGQALARASGIKLGPVVSISSCSGSRSSVRVFGIRGTSEFPVKYVGTDSSGIPVSTSVTVSFEALASEP